MAPEFNLSPIVRGLTESMGKKLGSGVEKNLPSIAETAGETAVNSPVSFRGAMEPPGKPPGPEPAMPTPAGAPPEMPFIPGGPAPETPAPAGEGASFSGRVAPPVAAEPPAEPKWQPDTNVPTDESLTKVTPPDIPMSPKAPNVLSEMLHRSRIETLKSWDSISSHGSQGGKPVKDYWVNRWFEDGQVPTEDEYLSQTPYEFSRSHPYTSMMKSVREDTRKLLNNSTELSTLLDNVGKHFDDTAWVDQTAEGKDSQYRELLAKYVGKDADILHAFVRDSADTIVNFPKANAPVVIPRPMSAGLTDNLKARFEKRFTTDPDFLRILNTPVGGEARELFNLSALRWRGDNNVVLRVNSLDGLSTGDLTPENVAAFIENNHQYFPEKFNERNKLYSMGFTKSPGDDRWSMDLNLMLPLDRLDYAKHIALKLRRPFVDIYDPTPRGGGEFSSIATGHSGNDVIELEPETVRELSEAWKTRRYPPNIGPPPASKRQISAILSRVKRMYIDWKTQSPSAEVDAVLNSKLRNR